MRTWPRGLGHVNRPKYANKATLVDGLRFDSRLEARRYAQLQLLQAAGEVDWFIRRPSFDLGGGVRYVADFLVVWANPHKTNDTPHSKAIVVEDCKGIETAAFKIKRRLMSDRYPKVELRCLTKRDVYGCREKQ